MPWEGELAQMSNFNCFRRFLNQSLGQFKIVFITPRFFFVLLISIVTTYNVCYSQNGWSIKNWINLISEIARYLAYKTTYVYNFRLGTSKSGTAVYPVYQTIYLWVSRSLTYSSTTAVICSLLFFISLSHWSH